MPTFCSFQGHFIVSCFLISKQFRFLTFIMMAIMILAFNVISRKRLCTTFNFSSSRRLLDKFFFFSQIKTRLSHLFDVNWHLPYAPLCLNQGFYWITLNWWRNYKYLPFFLAYDLFLIFFYKQTRSFFHCKPSCSFFSKFFFKDFDVWELRRFSNNKMIINVKT